jgi:hypothetical protein
MDDVVKVNIQLTDIADIDAVVSNGEGAPPNLE